MRRQIGRWIVAAALLCGGAANAQELRIGFLNTTTGPGAVLGKYLDSGWKLGLAHQGWEKDGDKIAGVPTRVFYGDDQMKPDVGVAEIEKFIKNDKVNIVTGFLWTNVMIAIAPRLFDAKVLMMTANAGPSHFAAEQCNPLYAAVSYINEDHQEAGAALVQSEGVKSVVVMAPNFQGGRDGIAGFKRGYKGQILEQILFKFGESDFQADLSKVRAVKPEAVFIFAPGAMGISFMRQWAASGLGASIKLYTVFTIDYDTLPAHGEAAIGSIHISSWDPESSHPRMQRFVKDFVARYGFMPSHLSVQAYDAAANIAKAVKAVGGDLSDPMAFARAIRKDGIPSVKGDIPLNPSGYPIQPYYKRAVVAGPDGKPTIKALGQIPAQPSTIWERCPAEKRL